MQNSTYHSKDVYNFKMLIKVVQAGVLAISLRGCFITLSAQELFDGIESGRTVYPIYMYLYLYLYIDIDIYAHCHTFLAIKWGLLIWSDFTQNSMSQT